ncbi:MAG: hypothetical protein IJE09_06725 [Oscillospiraceae bacterium]|nr:hypothetical protein [Oscillospiraceae bacterium]
MNEKAFLDSIIGQKLAYAIKSPDTELYDFGFGEERETDDNRMLPPYILHILCRFKIIHKDGSRKVQICHEDTTPKSFNKKIEPLIGLSVKRVGLSDKNDLWLDFGAYWVVFATFEEADDEAWRFFIYRSYEPHLVATSSVLEFQ